MSNRKVDRLDALILAGERLAPFSPPLWRIDPQQSVNVSQFTEWRISSTSLITTIFGASHLYVQSFAKVEHSTIGSVQYGLGILRAARAEVAVSEEHISAQGRAGQGTFDLAIVCALHTPELQKVFSSFKAEWSEVPASANDPGTYHRAEIATLKGSSLSVVAGAPVHMGLTASAVMATKLILRFRPRLVAMVGIAAGVRRDRQGFGDVLAAEHTFDYGAGKLTMEGQKLEFLPDPKPHSIHPRLLARLKEWERSRRELDAIQSAWPARSPQTRLTLHIGPLASGAAVVDTPKPVAELVRHWRKLIGLEMEAYAVHASTIYAADPQPMYLCLKSICDFAQDKDDDWQDYASYTAAELACRFVTSEWENLFPESTPE